jgi:hypothetical protein
LKLEIEKIFQAVEWKGTMEAMQVTQKNKRQRILTTADADSCPTHKAGKNVSSPDSNTSLGS